MPSLGECFLGNAGPSVYESMNLNEVPSLAWSCATIAADGTTLWSKDMKAG